MAVRPKSVRNRCIIELFVTLFVLSLYPFDNYVGIGAFVIGLSYISSYFFLSNKFLDLIDWLFHILDIVSTHESYF